MIDQDNPHESPSEKRWLFFYTITSWCYRVFVTLSIALFIANEFFFFGVLVAVWSVISLVCIPFLKGVRYVLINPSLQRKRQRAKTISLSLVVLTITLLVFVPAPSRTQSQGVVWLPEQSMLRAGENGFFGRWLVEPGSWVQKGIPVFIQEDPQLSTSVDIAQAKVQEAQARYSVEQFTNPAKAEIAKNQLEQEKTVLQRAQEKVSQLLVYSQSNGTITASKPQDMPGQYLKKGELVAYVLNNEDLVARIVVDQSDIDLVRTRLRSAELRFADSLTITHATSVLRHVPAGTQELPTNALSSAHGGIIAVDPQDSNGTKALERIFIFDMNLPTDLLPSAFGEKVYVRFNHHFEPLGFQIWRKVRQVLLSRLGV